MIAPAIAIAFSAVVTGYSIYWALSLLAGGAAVLRGNGDADDPPAPEVKDGGGRERGELPFISIVVAARNEEKVVGRLVEHIEELNYPRDRYELVFAEDGSTDGTLDRLRELAEGREWIRVYHLEGAGSKAAAVNRVIGECRGELLYFVDADAVPEPDALMKVAAAYAAGYRAMAGQYAVLNSGEGLMSRMVVFEELAWRLMCEGRALLNLACPLPGFNYAIEKRLLMEVGGLKEGTLAEDAALTVALVDAGVRPGYSSALVWLSAPSTLGKFMRQRIRWYRGYLDTLAEGARRLGSIRTRDALDIVLLFSSPVFALLSLINLAFMAMEPLEVGLFILGAIAGAAVLAYAMGKLGERYRRERRIAPLAIVYGFLLSIASSAAVLLHLLRFRRTWNKDEHSAYVDPDTV